MNYWLMKSEPSTFSVDDLAKRPGKRDSWDGVRNYQARNFLRAMHKGDLAFFYHSSAENTGIAGIVKIVAEAYPDPTAFDPKDHHYDPKSDATRPVWYMVDVKLKRKLQRLIPLAELKARRELKGMTLLRPGNRLSVMPVEAKHWGAILKLEQAGLRQGGRASAGG
jgi:predicted RNA-binding protein with PUA-like domain